MKMIRKIVAVLLVCVMLGAVMVSAGATSVTPAGNGVNYTAQVGTSVTFNKYLIMPAGTRTPAATFSYTIAPGTARTASSGKMAVLAGVGNPTVSNSVFTSDQARNTTASAVQIDVQRTDRENVKWESTNGEQFAVSTSTVDFSSVSFTEPGIYRYIVTETASETDEAKGIIHDDDVDRVLDVYVTDDGSGMLVVSQYVLHRNEDDVVAGANYGSADVASEGAALNDKTDGFTNEYKPGDLGFKKEVDGNQASRDKFFEFTVVVAGLTDTDVFNVSIADDGDANTNDGNALATSGANDATIMANTGKTNKQVLTGAELAAGVKYYLAHGQSVVIRGLPVGVEYAVTENAEDYKSTAKGVTDYEDETSGTIESLTFTKTSYKNTRDGVIPTGILLTIAPYIGVLVVGLAAIVFFIWSKKRKQNDQ